MEEKLTAMYGGKVRVRVCGICIEDNSLLLIRHVGLGEKNMLWIPPGGGIEFGEDASLALEREFLEETGLSINIGQFLFVNEFINDHLHAIELFFNVSIKSGTLKIGVDPELNATSQIINEARFVTFEEIGIMDKKILHNSLQKVRDKDSLLNMTGYFKFCQ